MEFNFEKKRILVTGACRGIGRELALHLSSNCNATVLALSRTKESLDSLAQEDKRIETVCCDLQNWKETRAAILKILPIDYLVNNAGVARLNSFFEASEDDFDESFAVNVKAIVNVSQIVADNMRGRKVKGSIVNVSSQASQAALQDHTVYCASKGAVDMLTKCMALELGLYNIRVNAVNPTVVMTAMGKLGWSDPQKSKTMLSKIPLGRFAEVSEVVNAIVFLLSDHSSMSTGTTFPVDGGFLAT